MPTTFHEHAADFDGDGRRDITSSVADALASTANMLKKGGWEPGKTWGYEVVLPRDFAFQNAPPDRRQALSAWQAMGIRRVDGAAFPRPSDQASLIVPAGVNGPAFLVLPNFHALRRYNGAQAYAFALGHLSDRLVGGEPFRQSWPTDQPLLSRSERQELQAVLTQLGFETGGTDGTIGTQTRNALCAFQLSAGHPADGFPSHDMLRHLRTRIIEDLVTGTTVRRTSANAP
jgi:membrane-bound lytic murein transglycosylase B